MNILNLFSSPKNDLATAASEGNDEWIGATSPADIAAQNERLAQLNEANDWNETATQSAATHAKVAKRVDALYVQPAQAAAQAAPKSDDTTEIRDRAAHIAGQVPQSFIARRMELFKEHTSPAPVIHKFQAGKIREMVTSDAAFKSALATATAANEKYVALEKELFSSLNPAFAQASIEAEIAKTEDVEKLLELRDELANQSSPANRALQAQAQRLIKLEYLKCAASVVALLTSAEAAFKNVAKIVETDEREFLSSWGIQHHQTAAGRKVASELAEVTGKRAHLEMELNRSIGVNPRSFCETLAYFKA